MIAFASSLDQAGPLDPRRDRRRADVLATWSGATASTPPRSSSRGRSRRRSAEDLKGIRLGVPEDLTGAEGGIEPGVRESFEATLALAEGLGASIEPCRLPHAPHALSAYYLIAPGRGVGQPGPVRRRPLRPAGRRRRGPAHDVQPHARGGLRRRGQAPDHARHLRAVERLLRRVLRDRAEGPHEDRRGLRERVRALRLHRHPDQPVHGVRARRQGRRPAGHVPERLPHGPDVAGRDPRDLDPVGSERRAAGRLPARRAGVQREPSARRGLRARAGDRIRSGGPARVPDVRARHRPRDPRPAGAPGRRCSAGASCRSTTRPTSTPARPAWACRGRCRWSTSGRSTSGS